jgi:hypothetical protein
MAGEVARRPRRGIKLEIGRRCDDRHAHVGRHAHGDHVFLDLLAEPHAGVEALRHDVGEGVVDADLDGDFRIVARQSGDGGVEHAVGGVLAGADADGAGRRVAQAADRRQRVGDAFEMRADRPRQPFARFGRRHAAGRARQQPQTESLLQAAHGLAQGRLRHAELRRGAGEALLARDGEEGVEVVEVDARH